MILIADSVLVPVLLAGPPLIACCWLLWRTIGAPIAGAGPMTPRPSGTASRRSRCAVAGCAAAMYVAALFLPTIAPFNPTFSTTTYPGYVAFGAWKVLVEWVPTDIEWWVLSLAWLANPAIWTAIVLTAAGFRRTAGVSAWCGLVLGLVPLPWGHSALGELPGYWVWVGSAGVLAAASLGPWRRLPTGPADEGGLAADYDAALVTPNHSRAPDRGRQ